MKRRNPRPSSSRTDKPSRIPVVMRIRSVQKRSPLPPRLTFRALSKGPLKMSSHGVILFGSMPLLTLALWIGWQMASPAAEAPATYAVSPIKPASVVAAEIHSSPTPKDFKPRQVESVEVVESEQSPSQTEFDPEEQPTEQISAHQRPERMPVQQVPYEEPVMQMSEASYADDDSSMPRDEQEGRAVRVQSVVPVYSDPPLSHPSVRSRIVSRRPIPRDGSDSYRR